MLLQGLDFDLSGQLLLHLVFFVARDSQDEELHGGLGAFYWNGPNWSTLIR